MSSELYETQLGDTWDIVAKLIYGSEIYADYLMQSNPKHIATAIFSAGTILYIPALPDEEIEGLPEWRE